MIMVSLFFALVFGKKYVYNNNLETYLVSFCKQPKMVQWDFLRNNCSYFSSWIQKEKIEAIF